MVDQDTVRWGMGDAAVGLVPAFLGAVALLAGGDSDSGSGDDLSLTAVVVGQVFVWAFLLGAPLFASLRKGNGPVSDFGLRLEPADMPRGLGIGVLAQLSLVPLYILLQRLAGLDANDVDNEAQELLDATRGAGLVVLFVMVVVLAPLIEELFFRGLLLRSIERRFGTNWAVAGSSVVFGLSHVQGIQLPALVLFGFVAALLTVRSGRLGPAIFAHVAFNGFTFVVLVLTT